jgi:hypothetical protein
MVSSFSVMVADAGPAPPENLIEPCLPSNLALGYLTGTNF